MPDKPKPDETEEKPQAVKDTLEEALGSVDRTFDGKAVTEEEDAGEEPVMSGHPATELEEPETDVEKGADSEEVEEAEKETPEEKPKAESKYKSHEEAEAAAAEGQRQITKLSIQLQEANDLLLKTMARQKAKPEEDESPAVETADQFTLRRRRKALDEIEALDPDDEGHKDKVAEIQARADREILKYHQEEIANLEAQKKEESKGVQTVIDQAQKAMREAGLNPETDSPDSAFFWTLAQLLRKRGDLPVSIDDQIAMCINEVKKYKNEALENYRTEEAKRRAEERQEDQPLGRGQGGPPKKDEGKPEAAKPVTLGGVLDAVVESRRI